MNDEIHDDALDRCRHGRLADEYCEICDREDLEREDAAREDAAREDAAREDVDLRERTDVDVTDDQPAVDVTDVEAETDTDH